MNSDILVQMAKVRMLEDKQAKLVEALKKTLAFVKHPVYCDGECSCWVSEITALVNTDELP